jgi:hypothetical protein
MDCESNILACPSLINCFNDVVGIEAIQREIIR